MLRRFFSSPLSTLIKFNKTNGRLFSSYIATYPRSIKKIGKSPFSPLLQIKNKFPNHFSIISMIWKHRSIGTGPPSKSNLLTLRNASSNKNATTNDKGGEGTKKGDKKMSDSFIEILLPFKQDQYLREEYTSMHGGLRFGKIMEDLDALAASIAYLHCDDSPNITLVTAAVDRIDLLKTFDRIINVRLRGFVTFVGKSSMEITMSVEMYEGEEVEEGREEGREKDNCWELAALAKFVFVARTLDGQQAASVPRLILETTEQDEIYKLGKLRHQYRLRRNETSLFRQPPTEIESRLLHSLLVATTIPNSVPMHNTLTQTIIVCHPQERNIHNRIFGGYLMREAFELAYSTAAIFIKGSNPIITTVEDITFVHPVPIGSILRLDCQIVYVEKDVISSNGITKMHLEVIADVLDPKEGTRVTTNTFHFTFVCPTSIQTVIPETYTEAMKYLEGKRRIELSDCK